MGKYTLAMIMAASMVFGISAIADDSAPAKGGEHKKGEGWNPEAIFTKMDANNDGKVSKDEYVASQEERAKKSGHEMKKEDIEARFAKMDKDSDGSISKDEWKTATEEMKARHAAHGDHKAKAPDAAKQ